MMFSVCIGSVRSATLMRAVDSIRRQTWDTWELIIVGQGSDPALRVAGAAAMSQDGRIRYLHAQGMGACLARNIAVQASHGDIIAITDDDCEARADWLTTLARYFDAEPDVDVVGGALIAPKPARRGLAMCPHLIPTEAVYDPVASGRQPPPGWDWWTGNVALRRSIFNRTGPLDESFGPGGIFKGADDTDYKIRLEAAGVKMRSTPNSVVFHTFGFRHGVRAMLRRSLDYAWAHGALAGKLTLLGDPRGREWLRLMQRRCTIRELRHTRPERWPLIFVQLAYFSRAYRWCRRHYVVESGQGVLRPLHATSAAATARQPT